MHFAFDTGDNGHIKLNLHFNCDVKSGLNLSLFQNLWFHSLMNVLFNSYHVTAMPSLNHSLLDAWLNSFHSKLCRIEINQYNQAFNLFYEFRNSEFRIRNLEL